ncbi:hypothetical protein PACTADRAFT_77289 [Pachysolen tannophilus NRRL Y-2460]|uniref:Cystathionine gamma-synthase n=1 Tax=Pachysolen tannophilus NRRL Y-2460 TaxID=669874 RepID=A0A1E4TPV1_PACTA|nr:hypothetical protein PACTADRAFT_77289 [Pachysolen tannophilus NRRL Y-2460]
MVGLGTNLIHGDDSLSRVPDVVQPINVSTTYRYDDDPDKLRIAAERGDEIIGVPYYSRLSHPNSEKVEQLLQEAVFGNDKHVIIYNSGLSAFFAALTFLNPKVLAIGKGYHGCHGIANIFTRLTHLKQISLEDDFNQLSKGDVIHLETPVNPEGTAFDINYFANEAHKRGAYLIVDATFAPPPLQDPFLHGADIVMHSATKYFGGHSDLLAGALITKNLNWKEKLVSDRLLLGTNIANLESFFLLRSLRTYELRILKQSSNAENLVKYLFENINQYKILSNIYHSSLQNEQFVKDQLTGGHSPTFSILLTDEKLARILPSKLKYFHHATSLGGVESLIEWRAMSDTEISTKLLRVSVGIENIADLINDFHQALKSLENIETV